MHVLSTSDARCPMHGEVWMFDTDAHETLAFHLINGSQNVSSKHHFWINRKHLCVKKINTSKENVRKEKINDISKEAKDDISKVAKIDHFRAILKLKNDDFGAF